MTQFFVDVWERLVRWSPYVLPAYGFFVACIVAVNLR